jgi:uncharacterized membrane protein
MTEIWWAVLLGIVGTYAAKLAGHSVPERLLDRPIVHEVSDALPIALLSALVAVQTFAIGQELVLDARAAGLAVAVVALLLRAPFLVVVLAAAATAGVLRAVGLAA